jgi:glycosyltransferase involved in cell wall biosynthesis
MYNIGFIIEQALGHQTHGQNLQKLVPLDPEVKASWGLPAWKTNGLLAKTPLIRSNWTMQAGLQARQMVASMTRESHMDALFFHSQITAVLSPDWLQKYPAVVSLDATPKQYDSLGLFYEHATGPEWLEQWKWRLNRTCFRRARQLVTWSQWAKQGLVEEYEVPAEKVTVIPPGVDTAVWAQPGRDYHHDGPLKILFVGGNLERKGGLLLLDVFRQLNREGNNHLENNGSYRIANTPIELHLVTRDTVPGEPGVHVYNDMQPNSPALKQLYRECDIFCLPTYGDCLPMVLSEAGAAGLPAITTKVAAIPEIVLNDQTGFLISTGDGQALKDTLQTLLSDADLRRMQGRQAVAQIQNSFDAGKNVTRLLDLLKETANRVDTADPDG